MITFRLGLLIPVLIISLCACAQQDSSVSTVSPNYLSRVTTTSDRLQQKIERKSEKEIEQLQKLELKMKRKLAKTDSVKANAVFGDAQDQYARLGQRLDNVSSKQYIPSLDTLATSLKFLQQNPQFITATKESAQKIADASSKVTALENQFQRAEEVKKFLKERKEYLKQQLGQVGFVKQFKQLNKQVYYYLEQINSYKELLHDHKKAEVKAIGLLSKTKLFQDFMRKNSQLASLFRLPGDPNDPTTQANLAGLQTRAQVNGLIQQQLGAGGPNAQAQFQQNMQQAQSQLNQIKNKALQSGKGSSDDIMPEGFKSNDQKIKSFLKRLEFGANIQSQKANSYFPTTSDIGFSLGYRLNSRSVWGIGTSYKLGWGKDIRHINITHQGIGLRSFIDYKLKGSFWISGGYEMNYKAAFRNIDELRELNAWQQSGLIGVSKIFSVKTKLLKQTKLQLLWDMLSYQQKPKTQSVIFRLGYTIN